jgi:glycosyltransferase involved in cell wall biosynthesis
LNRQDRESRKDRRGRRVAVIGVVGLPPQYGGFETLVDRLSDETQLTYVVYCSGRSYAKRPEKYRNARLRYVPIAANGVWSIPYDMVSALHARARGERSFLFLGVSGALVIPLLRATGRVTVVINIDGLEWRRAKWGRLASLVLRTLESVAVRFASTVIADNPEIQKYVAATYQRSARLIAYGGDPRNKVPLQESSSASEVYALALCRIEPENNVAMILEGFRDSALKLKFVGNWSASLYGRRLRAQFENDANIQLLDPVYDVEKKQQLQSNCAVYVHGHSAGGTNPSLVEMMWMAKPILAFDCAYNRATLHAAGDYFSSAQDLSRWVQKRLPTAARDERVLEIASIHYRWEDICALYRECFLSGGQ